MCPSCFKSSHDFLLHWGETTALNMTLEALPWSGPRAIILKLTEPTLISLLKVLPAGSVISNCTVSCFLVLSCVEEETCYAVRSTAPRGGALPAFLYSFYTLPVHCSVDQALNLVISFIPERKGPERRDRWAYQIPQIPTTQMALRVHMTNHTKG